MKKLLIIAIALIGLQATAQEVHPPRQERTQRMQDLTPEEAATLKSKKMALSLDLSEKQRDQVYALFLSYEKDRRQMMETRKNADERPSKEERLAMENARLDKQIEMKKKMKEILNEEQYAKWEKMMGERRYDGEKMKKRMKPRE